MKRLRLPSLVLALLCLSSTARAEIELIGPEGPVKPGMEVEIAVKGLPLDQLFAAHGGCTPAPKLFRASLDWFTREPYLRFRADVPGEYVIEVGTHAWIQKWREAIAIALLAPLAELDRRAIQQMARQIEQMALQYPPETATLTIVVEGENPNPPPPPPPPGVAEKIVVLETTEERTAEIGRIVNSPEILEYCATHGLEFSALDDEQSPPEYLAAKKELPLPVLLVIARAGHVLHVVALPSSEDGVVEVLRQFVRAKKGGG